MPAATFESVYQSANLKRSSSISSQEGQPDECTAKKLKVDIDDVKELVQVRMQITVFMKPLTHSS